MTELYGLITSLISDGSVYTGRLRTLYLTLANVLPACFSITEPLSSD